MSSVDPPGSDRHPTRSDDAVVAKPNSDEDFFVSETEARLIRERDRFGNALRDLISAIHEYTLWEPGRAGHAQAHRDLHQARMTAEGVLMEDDCA